MTNADAIRTAYRAITKGHTAARIEKDLLDLARWYDMDVDTVRGIVEAAQSVVIKCKKST